MDKNVRLMCVLEVDFKAELQNSWKLLHHILFRLQICQQFFCETLWVHMAETRQIDNEVLSHLVISLIQAVTLSSQ